MSQNQNQQNVQIPNPTPAPADPTAAATPTPSPQPPRRSGHPFTDSKANAFADKVLRWELLEKRLEPVLDAMPYIKPVHAELVQLLADAKAFEFELSSQKAAVRQKIVNRKALVKAGDTIRARLGAAIVFEHGPTSVLLGEFGLKPRSGGRPSTVKPTPPPPLPEATTSKQ